MKIEDYVNKKFEEDQLGREIAEHLGISVSMVSAYRKGDYNPSLEVAKKIYAMEGIVFHPFSKEGLEEEIRKDRRYA